MLLFVLVTVLATSVRAACPPTETSAISGTINSRYSTISDTKYSFAPDVDLNAEWAFNFASQSWLTFSDQVEPAAAPDNTGQYVFSMSTCTQLEFVGAVTLTGITNDCIGGAGTGSLVTNVAGTFSNGEFITVANSDVTVRGASIAATSSGTAIQISAGQIDDCTISTLSGSPMGILIDATGALITDVTLNLLSGAEIINIESSVSTIDGLIANVYGMSVYVLFVDGTIDMIANFVVSFANPSGTATAIYIVSGTTELTNATVLIDFGLAGSGRERFGVYVEDSVVLASASTITITARNQASATAVIRPSSGAYQYPCADDVACVCVFEGTSVNCGETVRTKTATLTQSRSVSLLYTETVALEPAPTSDMPPGTLGPTMAPRQPPTPVPIVDNSPDGGIIAMTVVVVACVVGLTLMCMYVVLA